MTSGVALVTTVWLAGRARGGRHAAVLSAFVLYHVAIGVDRVVVFFDGPATQQLPVAHLHADVAALVAQGRVELFYRWEDERRVLRGACSADMATRLAFDECALYAELRGAVASDVASRQMLHAELAMRRLRARNQTLGPSPLRTRWLLHLDVDELFFCEGMATARPEAVLGTLVAALEAERPRIDELTVVNYEAAPTATSGGNYFVTTTTFRRHTARIPLTSSSQAALRGWQHRSPYGQFFLFYDNGKSLVRVPDDDDDDDMAVVPASVHHWRSNAIAWRRVANFFDPRRADVWHEPALRCCVLHFPVCGVEWLADKYARLGDFRAVWGGGAELKIAPCFHLQARDAWLRGGRDALAELYEAQVVVPADGEDGETFWRRQLRAGVGEEITFPRELLTARGFTADAVYEEEEEEEEDQETRETTRTVAPVETTQRETPTGLTVEKAWMLAAISDEYL